MPVLNDFQRARIKAQVRPMIEDQYQSTPNLALDSAVEDVRLQSPECFHTEATLSTRVFYHQPNDYVPCAGYIVPFIRRADKT